MNAQEQMTLKLGSLEMHALKFCACGHDGASHKSDELANLLQCSKCACDHFHYTVKDAEIDDRADSVDPSNGEVSRVPCNIETVESDADPGL